MFRQTLAIIICLLALANGNKIYAQGQITPENLDKLHIMEDSMMVTVDSMYTAYIPDTHVYYSENFARQLVRALKIPNSFYFPFDKLKDKINIIYPEGNEFRVFNWNIAPTPVTRRYYGAVQLPGEQLKLWGLVDYSEQLGKYAEDSVLKNHRWYGALYYKIITHEVNGEKVYTMFGLNASSPLSNKKVMDPMVIDDNGIRFGAQIFNVSSFNAPGRVNRFILEYKKQVQITLNYDEEKKMVIFDKLVSQVNDPNRKYTYVPSGEYDGFTWNNDQWNYVQNLIPVQTLKDGEAPSGTDPNK